MTEEMPEGAEIDNIYIENKALGIGHQPTKSFCSCDINDNNNAALKPPWPFTTVLY